MYRAFVGQNGLDLRVQSELILGVPAICAGLVFGVTTDTPELLGRVGRRGGPWRPR